MCAMLPHDADELARGGAWIRCGADSGDDGHALEASRVESRGIRHVDPADGDAFARIILHYADDRAELTRAREAARRGAIEHFAWAMLVPRLVEEIRRAASR
mgnify:CR=1 FL=1